MAVANIESVIKMTKRHFQDGTIKDPGVLIEVEENKVILLTKEGYESEPFVAARQNPIFFSGNGILCKDSVGKSRFFSQDGPVTGWE